jgi:ketosteroid isomerase-like protein
MTKTIFLFAFLIFASSSSSLAQTATTKTTTTKTTTTTVKPAATVTTSTQTNDPNAKVVRAAFDRLIEGIRKADVDIVTGVYQNSPNIIYFNNNGSTTRGWEQDRKNRETRYPDVTNVKLDPRDVRVEMLGTTGAYVTCLWTQTQDYKGTPESASGRMTLVFKKIGTAWKVVHLHTSPDRPDANRPVLPSERMPVGTNP